MQPEIYAGVDSGVGDACAVVFVQGGKILDTAVFKGEKVTGFGELAEQVVARARWVRDVLMDRVSELSAVGIESWEDQGGRQKFKKNYYTPMLLGALAAELEPLPVWPLVVWQPASKVLSEKRGLGWMKNPVLSRQFDPRLTNGHLRTAAAHALWSQGGGVFA